MKKLGELLVEREWVTREQLTQALRHQQVFGGRIGTCLLELTLLSEDRLTRALSDQLGVPPATVDDLRVIADGLIELVPTKLAWRARAVPFERFGNALSVAVVDTRDLLAQDELAFVTSRRLKVHVAPEVRVLEALEKHYNCPVEPRFARIWDRLNRAKYLWQDEPASGVRRRIAESTPAPPAPMPAPMLPSRDDEWQPAPPPPLESAAPPQLAAPPVAAASTSAPPPAPRPAVATAPTARPPEVIAPEGTAAVDPSAPTVSQKRRWFFGSKAAPAAAEEPAVVPPAPTPVAPERSFVPVVPPPPPAPAPAAAAPPPAIAPRERPAAPPAAPAPPPARPAAPASPPARPAAPASRAAPERASPRRPAAPAAAAPAKAPTAPSAAARKSSKDLETLPPAPTPTPLVGRAAPAAARKAEGGGDLEADTTPMLVQKPAATLDDLEERIDEVEERDDVAHAALSFLSRRFQRSLLFMIKGNHVAAWMGGGEGVDQRLFGEVAVGFDEPSAFLNLREGSQFYRGPLARLDAHQRLVRCWGGRYPKECLLLPVRIKKRLVAAIYLDRGNEDLGGTNMGELQEAAALLGRGLETFLIKRKRP